MPPKSAKGKGKDAKGGRSSAKGGKGGAAGVAAVPEVPPRIPVYRSKNIPTSHNHEKAVELQQKLKQIFNSYDRINAGRLSMEDAEQAARAAGLFISNSEDAAIVFDNLPNSNEPTTTTSGAVPANPAATAATKPGVPQDYFIQAVTKALVMRRFAPDSLPALSKSLDMFRNSAAGNVDWDTLKQFLTTVGHTPLTDDEVARLAEDFVDEKKSEFREQQWIREVFESKLSVAWPPANPLALLQQNPFTAAPT